MTHRARGGRSYAVKSDGTAWGWGSNANGAVGDGTTIDRLTPRQLVALSNVATIVAGGSTAFAIANGSLWAWGDNSAGMMGNGASTGNQPAPTVVAGLYGTITAVAVGANHVLALRLDGTVWAWGQNDRAS